MKYIAFDFIDHPVFHIRLMHVGFRGDMVIKRYRCRYFIAARYSATGGSHLKHGSSSQLPDPVSIHFKLMKLDWKGVNKATSGTSDLPYLYLLLYAFTRSVHDHDQARIPGNSVETIINPLSCFGVVNMLSCRPCEPLFEGV